MNFKKLRLKPSAVALLAVAATFFSLAAMFYSLSPKGTLNGSRCQEAIGSLRIVMATSGYPGTQGSATWDNVTSLADQASLFCGEDVGRQFFEQELLVWLQTAPKS